LKRFSLKRFSPAAIGLIVVAAFVILAGAAVAVVPAAMADPRPSNVAAASAATSLPPSASPTEIATASPSPTAEPSWDPSFPGWAVSVPVERPSPGPPQPAVTPTPAPYRDTVWNARIYVKNRVGAKGYDCVNAIWTAESKWNPRASNGNGAYGIPQAYPGSKMAAFGSNWRYSPLVQVKWGIWYVTSRYGSACGAYDFWQAHGWY
jgi:hypothetical protein